MTPEEVNTLDRHARSVRAESKRLWKRLSQAAAQPASSLIKKNLILSTCNSTHPGNGTHTHAHKLVMEDKYKNIHGTSHMVPNA